MKLNQKLTLLMITETRVKAIKNLLFHCGNLRTEDRSLILCDKHTRSMAEAFVKIAKDESRVLNLLEIPFLSNHGAEPSTHVAHAMKKSTLILSICTYSLAHSSARVTAGIA